MLLATVVILSLVIMVSYLKLTFRGWMVFLCSIAFFAEGRYIVIPLLVLVVIMQLIIGGSRERSQAA